MNILGMHINEVMDLTSNHKFGHELVYAFPDLLTVTPTFLELKQFGKRKGFRKYGQRWTLTFQRIHKLRDVLKFVRIAIRYHNERNKDGTETEEGDHEGSQGEDS